MAGHVSGRPDLQETGTISDTEPVATTIFSSQPKGKTDRETNVVFTLKDGENLQEILERKVDSAVRGEMMAQRIVFEAEAEIEARNGERKFPTLRFRRSVNNLNLSVFICTKQVHGQIRLRGTLLVCLENWN